MSLLRTFVVAAVAVLGAGAPAFASSAFLSGSTGAGTLSASFSNSAFSVTNLNNVTGANAAVATNLNSTGVFAVASTTSSSTNVTYTINAGMVIDVAGSDTISLLFWTAWQDNGSVLTLSSVTFTDTGGHTATLSTFSSVSQGDNSLLDFGNNANKNRLTTFVTDYSGYSLSGSFDRAHVANMQMVMSISLNSGSHVIGIDAVRVIGTAIPEPGTWALFSIGVVGLGLVVRRRKRRAAKPRAT